MPALFVCYRGIIYIAFPVATAKVFYIYCRVTLLLLGFSKIVTAMGQYSTKTAVLRSPLYHYGLLLRV